MPYGTADNPEEYNVHDKMENSNFSDYKDLSNLKSEVVIKEDVVLTIEEGGTLEIGGQLGTGGRLNGHTVGSFTQIVLNERARIENYGTLNCYGYIKQSYPDKHDDNGVIISNNGAAHGSKINNHAGSKTFMPLVIYDWKGGTESLHLNGLGYRIFPIDIFDFPNIQTEIVFNYEEGKETAILESATRVKAGGSVFGGDKIINLISGSNKSLFELKGGSISFKYVPSNDKFFTTNDATTNNVAPNKTYFKINGDLSLNSLKISISIATIDSSNFYLPISYKFNFTAFSNGKIDMYNSFKFLRGSRVKVNTGAAIHINNSVIFFQTGFESQSDKNTKKVYPLMYAPNNDPIETIEGLVSRKEYYAARLINNGLIEVNSPLAAKIETTSLEAEVKINKKVNNYVEVKDRGWGGTAFNNGHVKIKGYLYGLMDNGYYKFNTNSSKAYKPSLSNDIYYWTGDKTGGSHEGNDIIS